MNKGIIGAVGVLVVIAAALIFWPSGSRLGGPTGDLIASHIGKECGDSTRSKEKPGDFQDPAFMRQAREVIFITCPEGYVNPFAELARFSSASSLRHAFTTGGAKVQREWFCVADGDAIAGDFRGFGQLCAELHGRFRCPRPCRDWARAQQGVPPPALPRS